MAKFRKRLKNVSKAKRLPKVQSAASNTRNTKYRDLARSGHLAPPTGTLTADALQKLEKVSVGQALDITKQVSELSVDDDSNYEDDGTSIAPSCETTGTFASQYSQCSNISYNKFYSVFRADNKLHKEMWAILEAITEVIKEGGGTESNTEYHCAMLTTLEKLLDDEEQKDDQIRAVLALIYMGLKRVPEGILRKSFDSTVKMMVKILKKYSADSGDSVIIKSSIGILCGLLKVQDSAIWSLDFTDKIFSSVLKQYCLHPKPKLRKTSQDAVIALIRDNCCVTNNLPNSPADKVAKFSKEVLYKFKDSVSIAAEQTTILHVLGLMKRTIVYYSKSNIKSTCEEVLLPLLTLKYPIINLCSFQVLHTLFSHQTAIVPAEINGQLISALYDFQPSITDPQLTSAWLAVLQQAHSHLADVELDKACVALPELFAVFPKLWLNDNKEIISAVTQAIENVVRDVIQPATETLELIAQHKSKLVACFRSIEKCLNYQHSNVWPQVLHIMSVLFEVSGKTCSDLLTRCLVLLSELYDTFNFTYKKELEFTVGTAVRSMGPSVVLKAIPLKTKNNEFNLDRSWLLPVLRENVRGATLKFWYENILPLAKYCKEQSRLKTEANENIGARSYELLYQQLWNLLPSFCNKPSDIAVTFKTLRFKMDLAAALSNNEDLRSGVMASLRKLIASAKENEYPDDLVELKKTCKNYIPILFNIYTEDVESSETQGLRTSALDTVKVFLSISNSELTTSLFEKALIQFEKVESTFEKASMLDLIRALVPYQNTESIQKLYEGLIKRLIVENNHTQQKKAYRMLEQILKNESEGCQTFIKQQGKDVKILLKQNLESIAGPSKGSRINCFYYLVKAEQVFKPESKIIKMMISEAVVCCKDINLKCRTDARSLLNLIGEGFIEQDKADQFITILLQGLSENTEVMSATVLALTSILYNFTGGLGFQNIEFILENVTQLMKVPNRDVVSSGLDFIKMYCMVLPAPSVGASLPKIMSIVVDLSNDFKSHSRVKIKNILQKLVRKFGCESLLTYIPNTETTMMKILRNIRKAETRKKKQRDLERSQGSRSETEEEFTIEGKQKTIEEILADSDSEDEDEKPKAEKADKKHNTWIQEDIDTITDFTDPKVARRITSMNPKSIPTHKNKSEEVKDKNRGFKTDKEGRLIIADLADDDDEDDDDTDGKHDDYIDVDDADSDTDVIMTGKKRKRSEAGSTRSRFSTKSSVTSEPPMKYKPGGSGIHRPVGAEYKSKKGAGDMKKKGKLDPYAYIPLQRSTLNKRKRSKMAGQFKGIVPKGVKKGKVTKKTAKGGNR